ncbi:hypothetical protein PAPYR_2755 [Paratrimastix pyriformis]|uniref:Uncharacterized protein n=1 Tax=Paratrimastix pyriformis TaxID=342808 RepID=A0ABQ8UTN3_9EUKA|nr:hypothetical protein PAPYR_2755 [Paratrimastix pyriformis]
MIFLQYLEMEKDPEEERLAREAMAEVSRSMWKRINPGYSVSPVKSTAKSAFVDPATDLLEPHDWEQHRRRDNFSNYVEAAAKYRNMTGAPAKPTAPSGKEAWKF